MEDEPGFEAAAIGILAAVAFADGVLAAEEIAWWADIRSRDPAFSDIPPADFDALLANARNRLVQTPWQELVDDWSAQVPPERAETLYLLAIGLQLADGRSTRSESRVTAHLSRALGLPMERAMALFELEVHRRLGD